MRCAPSASKSRDDVAESLELSSELGIESFGAGTRAGGLPHCIEVEAQALQQQLDSAWLFAIMRSESALDETVISPANAHGLMQLTPGTARQLTRRYNLAYRNPDQLLDGRYNIRMGSQYVRDLMDAYDESPVITLSAYNAGPNAAERWLKDRPAMPADIWIELIPYFETRDYIPRVLAFATIYNWRLQQPVQRITSRMPALDSGSIGTGSATTAFVEVACAEPTVAGISGN